MKLARGSRTGSGASLLLLALLTLALTSCGSGRGEESEAVIPREPGDLAGTQWILVGTGDFDPPMASDVTLDIADGTASGRGPCNSYNLPFTVDGTDLTTGPIASTKMACEGARNKAEADYFRMLEAVDEVHKEGTEDQLVLSGPDDVRLVYEERP